MRLEDQEKLTVLTVVLLSVFICNFSTQEVYKGLIGKVCTGFQPTEISVK